MGVFARVKPIQKLLFVELDHIQFVVKSLVKEVVVFEMGFPYTPHVSNLLLSFSVQPYDSKLFLNSFLFKLSPFSRSEMVFDSSLNGLSLVHILLQESILPQLHILLSEIYFGGGKLAPIQQNLFF